MNIHSRLRPRDQVFAHHGRRRSELVDDRATSSGRNQRERDVMGLHLDRRERREAFAGQHGAQGNAEVVA